MRILFSFVFFFFLLAAYIAFADVIEDLESRGISRSEIEKVRMTIYENPKYKGLQAAIYYCDLIRTRRNIDRAIKIEKKIKGRSGSPSFSKLEELDNSYSINEMEIREQKKLYKRAFGKSLTTAVCKNQDAMSLQLDRLQDELLLKAFTVDVVNESTNAVPP